MPRLNPFARGSVKLAKRWDAGIDGHVVSLAWSASLNLLAAASADGPITLFDAATGQIRFNLLGHGFGTSQVAWSADGKHLASAGQDGKVRLWNPATGEQVIDMPAGAAWAERVAWCPVANILASAAGKKLRFWNLAGEMIRECPDHPSTIADLQWQPNAVTLASATYGKMFLWDCAALIAGHDAPEPPREFSWLGSMLVLAWSPDSKYVAAGGQDCTVHFWEVATGEDLQMAGYPTKVRELAWDPTGRYLATGGGPTPCVWDFSGKGPAGSIPVQLEAHEDNVTCLAYQHQGIYLASGGDDGRVALWQPSKQQGALAIARHAAGISQLAWSADDQRLAVGDADGAVILYALA